MNIYSITIGGFVIGQITFTVISSYALQRGKNIDWFQAVKTYAKAEVGNYAMALCSLAILLFLTKDYVDPNVDRKILLDKIAHKDSLTTIEKIVVYARTFSIAFGVLCTFLLQLAFRKGIKAISDYSAKNGITDPTKP